MGLIDDPQQPGPEQPDDMWNELLTGMPAEEPSEEEPAPAGVMDKVLGRLRGKQRQPDKAEKAQTEGEPGEKKGKAGRGKLLGLTRVQVVILGVLVVVVLCVYVALVVIITRTVPRSASTLPTVGEAGTITVVRPGTPQPWSGEVSPTPEAELGEEESPTPAPTEIPAPESTPTPLPPVSTRFDQKIIQNPVDVDLRLARGQEYLKLGAYEAALADFDYARTLDKERAEVYAGLGWANFYLRHWSAAESAFGTAISFNEDLPEAHFGLGQVYYYEGRYADAAQAFDVAAEINPEYVEAEAWLAIAAARFGNAEEALAATGRAISLTQKLPLVYIAQSWALRIQDPPDLDGAQSSLIHAQDLEPYKFEVLDALANFYLDYRPERLVEAEQLAQYAVNWSKGDLQRALSLQTLGRIYMKQGRKEDARRVFGEAADLATSDGRIVLDGLVDDLERALAP